MKFLMIATGFLAVFSLDCFPHELSVQQSSVEDFSAKRESAAVTNFTAPAPEIISPEELRPESRFHQSAMDRLRK